MDKLLTMSKSERLSFLGTMSNDLCSCDMYDLDSQLKHCHVVGAYQIVSTLSDNCINFALREYEMNPIWYDVINRYK